MSDIDRFVIATALPLEVPRHMRFFSPRTSVDFDYYHAASQEEQLDSLHVIAVTSVKLGLTRPVLQCGIGPSSTG